MGQANDHRRRRPRCYPSGAHHVWGGGLSIRAELCCKSAAMGDQAISAKIRIIEIFLPYHVELRIGNGGRATRST